MLPVGQRWDKTRQQILIQSGWGSKSQRQVTLRSGLDSLESSPWVIRCLLSVSCVPDLTGHWGCHSEFCPQHQTINRKKRKKTKQKTGARQFGGWWAIWIKLNRAGRVTRRGPFGLGCPGKPLWRAEAWLWKRSSHRRIWRKCILRRGKSKAKALRWQ